MSTDIAPMEHSQARPQGSEAGPAHRQPEVSAGEGLEDGAGYVAHQYWQTPGPALEVVHASHPFVAHPPPSHQHHTRHHTRHQLSLGASPPYRPAVPHSSQFQPPLHPIQPPSHPLHHTSYQADVVLSPHDDQVQPPLPGSIEPYWPSASNVASDSGRHEPALDSQPIAVASSSSIPYFSQAYHENGHTWDAAGNRGDVYRQDNTLLWLGESLTQSQAGSSLQPDYRAMNITSPQSSSDGRASFSGGSLGEGGYGFTALDLSASTSRALPPRDQLFHSTTSPSDVSSLSQYSSSLSTAVLHGKRPSSSGSPSAVGVENEDDLLRAEGISRLDKRRNQNKLAQRAFRARTKVNNAETSNQMAQLVEVNEAQSQRLADMAALIATLQQENLELKLAAINAGLPPDEHVASLGDERRPER